LASFDECQNVKIGQAYCLNILRNKRIAMGLYRTCFFGKAGLLPGCKPIHAGSDMDARRLASDLLRDSPEVESLEVWRDADLVLRMNRNQMRLKQLSWTGGY
jgi:hypothetical protein